MINLFRKTRKQLASDNKFRKYFRYAFGEVVLIMVGIFMALQLNNWNQKRLQEVEFKTSLEQLYNAISDEHDFFESNTSYLESSIEAIDFLLDEKSNEAFHRFPYTLWSLSFDGAYRLQTRSKYLIENLDYNPQNKNHKNISRQLQTYSNLIDSDVPLKNDFILKINNLLIENDIPYPGFDMDHIQDGFQTDSIYYSDKEFEIAGSLMANNHFRTLLKSERTAKTFQTLVLREQRDDAQRC